MMLGHQIGSHDKHSYTKWDRETVDLTQWENEQMKARIGERESLENDSSFGQK